jgi:hypothetical protein
LGASCRLTGETSWARSWSLLGTGKRLFDGAARTRLKLADVTGVGPDGVTIQRYTCA